MAGVLAAANAALASAAARVGVPVSTAPPTLTPFGQLPPLTTPNPSFDATTTISGLAGNDAVAASISRLQQAGIELDQMAIAALGKLPPEHAAEMLDYVVDNRGQLRNPSKYVTSTVSRGFVPRRGAAPSFAGPSPIANANYSTPYSTPNYSTPQSQPAIGASSNSAEVWSAPISKEDLDNLRYRAEGAGIVLSEEASIALGVLPLDHAIELVDFVIEKSADLRDVSNYIVSTVARGFTSRRNPPAGKGGYVAPPAEPGQMPTDVLIALQKCSELGVEIDEIARQALTTVPSDHAVEMLEYVQQNFTYLRNPSNYISCTVSRGFVSRANTDPSQAPPWRTGGKSSFKGGGVGSLGSKGKGDAGGKGFKGGLNSSIIPQDATALELRVLQFNAKSSAEGRPEIDFATYLAVRTLPEHQGVDLLDGLDHKGSLVASPCNYLQAAVTKIQRGEGKGAQSAAMTTRWDVGQGGGYVAGGVSEVGNLQPLSFVDGGEFGAKRLREW